MASNPPREIHKITCDHSHQYRRESHRYRRRYPTIKTELYLLNPPGRITGKIIPTFIDRYCASEAPVSNERF